MSGSLFTDFSFVFQLFLWLHFSFFLFLLPMPPSYSSESISSSIIGLGGGSWANKLSRLGFQVINIKHSGHWSNAAEDCNLTPRYTI
jgi:hypothetical protein